MLSSAAQACDSCSCALSRVGSDDMYHAMPWFFDFTVENINWNTRTAEEGHQLHHLGRDAHNKTHEEFYGFNLGFNAAEHLTLLSELPYVVRSSTEVDSHAHLGEEQTSEGIGDLKLSANYHFWHDHGDSLGVLGGIKLPTGATDETNGFGVEFEPELQPGSGSVDWFMGVGFRKELGPVAVQGNAVQTFKNTGDHDFTYGDAFSTYTSFQYILNPHAEGWLVTPGIDTNWQFEGKQRHNGSRVEDSGGHFLLAGPSLKIEMNERVAVVGSVLVPVYQNMGGVHQEMDFVWNASAKISW